MTLRELALMSKSLYDLSDNRIAMSQRVWQYGLTENPFWSDQIKALKKQERILQEAIEEEAIEMGFGDMMRVKGVGPRTVGGIVMHIIKTERIYHKNGKYKKTVFLDELKDFPSIASLWHYAGFHVVCANCGCTDRVCRNKETITTGLGEKKNKYTGCGNFVPTAAKKRRGKPVDWDNKFRSRLLSIASSLFRTGGPYSDIYKEERVKAIEKHPDWSKGRTFNHAKRRMIKRLLKDFWEAYLKEDYKTFV